MPLTISPPLTLPQFGGLLNYSWWWEVEGTCRAAIHNRVCLARLCFFVGWQHWTKEILRLCMEVMCTSTTQGLYFLGGFQQSWTLWFLFFSSFLSNCRYYTSPWLMRILFSLPHAQRGSCARGKRGNSAFGFGSAHPLVLSARWVLPLQVSWFSS